jgi:precorrin-6B methylase 2
VHTRAASSAGALLDCRQPLPSVIVVSVKGIVGRVCGRTPEPLMRSRSYDDGVSRALLLAGLTLLVTPAQRLAPFVATPEDVVDRMLALAGTTKTDVVYDLGSGDGRIPIRAAVRYGAKGVGIEIDPNLVEASRANAKSAGVEHLVEFRLQDVMEADVSQATIVTLYILSSGNAKLRPLLTRQLRPGARIVSHAFSMGPTWPADKTEHFTSVDGDEVTLYLWKADGRIRP